MLKGIKNGLALFFCSIILLLQGGFFMIHEHSLEVLSHKCVHQGEHDYTYSEDCDTCEIHANQSFLTQLDIELVSPAFILSIQDTYKSIELERKIVLHGQRGPPQLV